ncbi:sensor domain-containing diguanylate cyclase [Chitinolyticbacter albus]|uniref:sensor domain-containing diguanylate cyclase n=1 Tax=Chitinolyticbacter albus TaxID=2961951 RepID=UPI002109C7EA|nr:sensor domain-containing diguanylate cyclase [Chitinolyticbacter albus]
MPNRRFQQQALNHPVRTVVLLVVCFAIVGSVLAWFAATTLVRADFARVVKTAQTVRSQDLHRAAVALGQSLHAMQQAPAWLGKVGQLRELLADPDDAMRVDEANRWLTELPGKLSLDLVWVMDATGRVLASSNYRSELNLIGDRYDFRSYFREAMMGHNAMQYARGVRTGEPGFYFAGPIRAGSRVVGVVVAKVNVERVATEMMTPGLFVSDRNGVIVLSDQPLLRGRTLSDEAPVYALSANERVQRYRQQNFIPMPITRRDTELFHGLYALEGESAPVILLSSLVPNIKGMHVHAVTPLRSYVHLESRRWLVFALIETAGILLIAFVSALLVFVSRTSSLRLQLMDANAELQRQAETDFLTGAAMRRKFEQVLQTEMLRHRRYRRTLCLALIDLDHFKRINDEHGHLAGDEVLRQFVLGLQARVRGSDLLGRVGGEEFALLLPETDPDQALALLERLRSEIAQRPVIWNGRQLRLTFSAGLGDWHRTESMEALIARIDLALYVAKQGGRNQIVMAEAPGENEPSPVSGKSPA